MNRLSGSHFPSSPDSFAFPELSDGQRAQLAEVLERYLSALEQERPLDAEALITDHPEIAGSLRAALRSLDDLHNMAAGFGGSAAPATAPEDDRGQLGRIGDFRLVREVGRGGMGVVYEAWQLSLNRRVALKILPFAAVLDARQIARFKNEAQAAAQVQHPHIVPVFAIGVERGVHYYAMQFIDGQPLHRAIDELRARQRQAGTPGHRRRGRPELTSTAQRGSTHDLSPARVEAPVGTVIDPIDRPTRPTELVRSATRGWASVDTVVRLGIQAAEALQAAHEYGVVHRDVKPSNLLLDAEGKLWITDFGLARIRSDQALTQTGAVVGTMQYMSPEQAAGESTLVDQRTDVYSLGATLYELLTLHVPHLPHDLPHGSPGGLPVRAFEVARLRSFRPDVPADLDTVVLKALAWSRDERYLTAGDLAADLRRIRDGQPTMARPPNVVDRCRRWSRRHRRLVAWSSAACVLAFAALAAGSLLVLREKLRAEQSFSRAERYLHEAQDAVERFGVQLSERLEDVPEADDLRRELLHETLQYYRNFAARAGDDPSLRANLALVHGKIATLCEQTGDIHESLAAYRQALDLYTQLARAEADHGSHQQRLARCLSNYGVALQRAGRIDESRRALHDAIEQQQQLRETFPASAELIADLARSYANLGWLDAQTGRLAEAEVSLRAAIRGQEQLVTTCPEVPAYGQQLANSLNSLASLLERTDPDEAVRCYESALRHEASAQRSDPDDLQGRANRALTWNNLGSLQARRGDHRAAAESYTRAVEIQAELVRLAPSRRLFQRDLAVSRNNQGLAWSRLGQVDAAEESIRQAVAQQLPLVQQDGHDVVLRSNLGGSLNNLGMILEKRGKYAAAGAAFQSAIEHQRVAVQRAPDVVRYRQFLDQHYQNYSRVLRQMGDVDDASQVALARREFWDGER